MTLRVKDYSILLYKGRFGKCRGGEYIDEEVVVDGNLITSRTPKDLPAFLKAIIEKLK